MAESELKPDLPGEPDLAHRLLNSLNHVVETARRPATAATLNALEDSLKSFGKLIEKADKIPAELFAGLDDDQRKIALLAFGSAMLGSMLRKVMGQRFPAPERRIILPGRDR